MPNSSDNVSFSKSSHIPSQVKSQADFAVNSQMETLDMLDFDMESWNVFSSVAVDGATAQRDFVLCSY